MVQYAVWIKNRKLGMKTVIITNVKDNRIIETNLPIKKVKEKLEAKGLFFEVEKVSVLTKKQKILVRKATVQMVKTKSV